MVQKLIAYVIIFSSLTARADDITYLIKDKPAPFTGYLFSLDKEAIVRLGIKERDYYKDLTESQNKLIDLYKKNESIYIERIDLFKKQNDTLSQSLYNSQSTSVWEKVVYFGLGVLLSGVAFVAVKKISQ